jgi:hypothetical protein
VIQQIPTGPPPEAKVPPAPHVDLARNDRLEKAIVPELITATLESIRTGKTARCFEDFTYSTLGSWSPERRVIGNAR